MNISEGRDLDLIEALKARVPRSLLDVHRDPYHHRSVFTLAGEHVLDDAITLTTAAVSSIDIKTHDGVHPRIGAVDVVPFVPLGEDGLERPLQLAEALAARNAFASAVSQSLNLPCFLYGPERSLPDIRRTAFRQLAPDVGPHQPHPSAGACCVGARGVLIAYNINVEAIAPDVAATIARETRAKGIQCLSFNLDGKIQISCNLTDPLDVGIEHVYDAIAAAVRRSGGKVICAELVGLIPERILERTNPARWEALGLSSLQTIESRLQRD